MRGGRETMPSFDPPNYPMQTQSVLKGVSEPLLHMDSPNAWQRHLDGRVMDGLSQKCCKKALMNRLSQKCCKKNTHQLGTGTSTDKSYEWMMTNPALRRLHTETLGKRGQVQQKLVGNWRWNRLRLWSQNSCQWKQERASAMRLLTAGICREEKEKL